MTKVSFSEMSLTPKVERAVCVMGFDFATPIQSEAIPLIRTGVDVIARSQTGTGKTVAFAIPAIERVDTHEDKPTIQVMVLCPTRELAMQVNEEIRKLIRFKEGIRSVAIFGGAPIEKQCIDLRRANIVVGTPGRIMDHMRRKTIKLNKLKLIVLDEADEMLNMGFKEDIEIILDGTPEERQTVLFSATMSPAIIKITKEFQKNPTLVEIDKSQITIENIEQRFIDVPHAKKKEALAMLIKYYGPRRAIVFCATKKMVDELTEYLNNCNVSVESIHSDIKQSQRISTMRDFKAGKTTILIATDIAARGIDVSDVEFVINFDIPPNTEYYIHRIGRTGRAGKDGCSITICSSKREVNVVRQIAVAVKSEIKELPLPTISDIQLQAIERAQDEIEAQLKGEINPIFAQMISDMLVRGCTLQGIAEAALSLHYTEISQPVTTAISQFKHKAGELAPVETRRRTAEGKMASKKVEKKAARPKARPAGFGIMVVDIGYSNRINAHHIIGAITDRTGLSVKDIGKIDITPEQSIVEIPNESIEDVVSAMKGCKICGKPTHTFLLAAAQQKTSRSAGKVNTAQNKNSQQGNSRSGIPVKVNTKRSK